MPQQSLFHIQGGELRQGFSCTACALHQNPRLTTNCMQSTGFGNSPKFLFVGEAPMPNDDMLGKPMTGEYGDLLADLLREAGFSKGDVHFTNCIKCAPYDKKPTKTLWKQCKQHFFAEVERLKPEVIIAVGGTVLEWLTGHGGVTKLARKGLPLLDSHGLVAYPLRQPAILFHKQGNERWETRRAILDELRWLLQEQRTGRIGRPTSTSVDYLTCSTEADVDELFAELETLDEFVVDIETVGLFPDADKRILAIGFSWKERFGRALPLYARGVVTPFWWEQDYLENSILPRLKDLLLRKKVYGHNLIQFDQKWLRIKLGIQNLIVDFDTQFCHYILNEERGSHGLEELSMLYTDMVPWKREFNTEDTIALCNYLCKDVDATFRIRKILEPQLNTRQRWLLDNILIPLAKELFEVECAGVCVDQKALDSLNSMLAGMIDKASAELHADKFVRLFEIAENTVFDHASPPQLRVLFEKYLKLPMIKKTDSGLYSTDKDVLNHYKDEPVCGKILKIRRLSTLKSTYGEQIEREVRNGRVHTSYKVHGTVTGRPASEVPNLMNMPREDTAGLVMKEAGGDGKEIKRCFIPAPGCCMIEADYSQAELRVLAAISKDKNLIDIYRQGIDVHTATAAAVYNIPLSKVTTAQRSLAKPVNFGIVYGMQLEGLIKKFESAGSTAAVAQHFLNAHKQKFPQVWEYMAEQEALIRKQKFQETYFGRRRRYQEIDNAAIRQAYNFPIQSMASDLTLIALIRIAQAVRLLKLPARIVLTVYDSIVAEAEVSVMWEVASLMEHIMRSIHFEWMLVPMEADLKAGLNWGDLKKIDVAKRIIE